MRSETITRGNVTLRKEAIYGIESHPGDEGHQSTIMIYLIGGQTIRITLPNDQFESELRAWKNSANLL